MLIDSLSDQKTLRVSNSCRDFFLFALRSLFWSQRHGFSQFRIEFILAVSAIVASARLEIAALRPVDQRTDLSVGEICRIPRANEFKEFVPAPAIATQRGEDPQDLVVSVAFARGTGKFPLNCRVEKTLSHDKESQS